MMFFPEFYFLRCLCCNLVIHVGNLNERYPFTLLCVYSIVSLFGHVAAPTDGTHEGTRLGPGVTFHHTASKLVILPVPVNKKSNVLALK